MRPNSGRLHRLATRALRWVALLKNACDSYECVFLVGSKKSRRTELAHQNCRLTRKIVRQHAYSGAVVLDFALDYTSVGQADRGDENLSPTRVHRLCMDDFVSADCHLCRVT